MVELLWASRANCELYVVHFPFPKHFVHSLAFKSKFTMFPCEVVSHTVIWWIFIMFQMTCLVITYWFLSHVISFTLIACKRVHILINSMSITLIKLYLHHGKVVWMTRKWKLDGKLKSFWKRNMNFFYYL